MIAARAERFDPIGGMQNHAAQLTRALDRRELEQIVITTRPPTAPRRALVGERAEVIRLGLPLPWFRQLYAAQAAVVVPRVAREADLVHVHLGEDLAVLPLGRAAARARRVPLVVTVHCSLRHTLAVTNLRTAILKTVGGWIERRGERSADAVIVLTPRLRRVLVEEGIDAQHVHVIPSGVTPALFAGPQEDPFPEVPRPRVAYVGRLAAQKGVRTLVDAVPLMKNKDAHLVVVGDGPERRALERGLEQLGLGGRVHLTRFLSHDRVPAVLAHADVFVMPSRYEELGSALVEAMHVGLPIVASRTGGIPDVIAHGESGLLADPGDPAAFADAIDRLLADSGLARRLGEGARRAAGAYDWDALAERVLGVYRAVASRDQGSVKGL